MASHAGQEGAVDLWNVRMPNLDWHGALTQKFDSGVDLGHINHQSGDQPISLEALLIVPKR